MRVVAGKVKGRPLKAVKGMGTRPTTDKVKESIFNMIGPFFNGGLGFDLFAGSGGMGIEALSRGLDKVIFVDRDPKAIETVYLNLKQCKYMDNAEVYRTDANRALKAVIKRKLSFSLIILDPPYKNHSLNSLIKKIDEHQLLNEDGCIVVEHSSDVILPEIIGSLSRTRYEKYSGTISVSIYIYN